VVNRSSLQINQNTHSKSYHKYNVVKNISEIYATRTYHSLLKVFQRCVSHNTNNLKVKVIKRMNDDYYILDSSCICSKNIPEKKVIPSAWCHSSRPLGNKGSLEGHSSALLRMKLWEEAYSATCSLRHRSTCHPVLSVRGFSSSSGGIMSKGRVVPLARSSLARGLSPRKYIKLYTSGPLQRIFLSARHPHPSTQRISCPDFYPPSRIVIACPPFSRHPNFHAEACAVHRRVMQYCSILSKRDRITRFWARF